MARGTDTTAGTVVEDPELEVLMSHTDTEFGEAHEGGSPGEGLPQMGRSQISRSPALCRSGGR